MSIQFFKVYYCYAIYIYMMACQKLCQNIYIYSVSGWGSREESNFWLNNYVQKGCLAAEWRVHSVACFLG